MCTTNECLSFEDVFTEAPTIDEMKNRWSEIMDPAAEDFNNLKRKRMIDLQNLILTHASKKFFAGFQFKVFRPNYSYNTPVLFTLTDGANFLTWGPHSFRNETPIVKKSEYTPFTPKEKAKGFNKIAVSIEDMISEMLETKFSPLEAVMYSSQLIKDHIEPAIETAEFFKRRAYNAYNAEEMSQRLNKFSLNEERTEILLEKCWGEAVGMKRRANLFKKF